jgi:hypothetical protein
MTMTEYKIFLIGADNDDYGILQLSSSPSKSCEIVFKFKDIILTATDTDYFDAFCKIRLQLEAYNLIPFCYGASLNVYPSGMSREMG